METSATSHKKQKLSNAIQNWVSKAPGLLVLLVRLIVERYYVTVTVVHVTTTKYRLFTLATISDKYHARATLSGYLPRLLRSSK